MGHYPTVHRGSHRPEKRKALNGLGEHEAGIYAARTRLALAKRVNELKLARQLVRVVWADAPQFLQPFFCGQLRPGVLPAGNHAVRVRILSLGGFTDDSFGAGPARGWRDWSRSRPLCWIFRFASEPAQAERKTECRG